MTEPHIKPDLERYRLPVQFSGDYTIHPMRNPTPGDSSNEAEERWLQKHSIGKGAFGEVWLQEEQRGGELRAVKRLAQVVQGVDFSRELVTLTKLADHRQYFVQFYGWYEDLARSFVFVAMEFVQGGDLSRYIGDPVIRSEAKEITKQLLLGLVVMHERLICHRDIKPKNVLVVSLKPIWIKLADFGVSKIERDTHLRTTAGTLAYSAPEIYGLLPRRLKPRDVYTNAVDMWSLGCLVHEMLTTERPFHLQAALEDDLESSMGFDTVTSEPQANIDMIVEFCRDQQDFPEAALERSGVSASERSFVKALLLPDPRLRLSAAMALASPWISGESKSGGQEVHTEDSFQLLTRVVARNCLQMFYPEIPEQLISGAQSLATELSKRGCPRIIAASLGVLVLYDLALLIGDGDSMLYDQSGERIHILQRLLDAIASVYSLASESGVMTARFINTAQAKKNITAQTVKSVISGHDYGGITRVGSELKRKIIDNLVSQEMKKPLLVIIIGDQAAEGEPSRLLEDVLKNCLRETRKEDGVSKGAHSTAFQFLRIGDNSDGVEILQRLTRDYELKGHVHFRRVHEFNHNPDSQEYWIEITQILLGAITENWG